MIQLDPIEQLVRNQEQHLKHLGETISVSERKQFALSAVYAPEIVRAVFSQLADRDWQTMTSPVALGKDGTTILAQTQALATRPDLSQMRSKEYRLGLIRDLSRELSEILDYAAKHEHLLHFYVPFAPKGVSGSRLFLASRIGFEKSDNT